MFQVATQRSVSESTPAGDSVVEIGSAELTLASGQIVTVKYVVRWKHHDGTVEGAYRHLEHEQVACKHEEPRWLPCLHFQRQRLRLRYPATLERKFETHLLPIHQL
jgi:hypothetical protein